MDVETAVIFWGKRGGPHTAAAVSGIIRSRSLCTEVCLLLGTPDTHTCCCLCVYLDDAHNHNDKLRQEEEIRQQGWGWAC